MLAVVANAGTWDVLRAAVLLETLVVAVMYLWAVVDLLRSPRPTDKTLKAIRVGRFCRVLATLGVLALAGISVVERFDRANLAAGLIPWQVILFLFAAAWALLDRTRYQDLGEGGVRVPAAGSAIESMADRELREGNR